MPSTDRKEKSVRATRCGSSCCLEERKLDALVLKSIAEGGQHTVELKRELTKLRSNNYVLACNTCKLCCKCGKTQVKHGTHAKCNDGKTGVAKAMAKYAKPASSVATSSPTTSEGDDSDGSKYSKSATPTKIKGTSRKTYISCKFKSKWNELEPEGGWKSANKSERMINMNLVNKALRSDWNLLTVCCTLARARARMHTRAERLGSAHGLLHTRARACAHAHPTRTTTKGRGEGPIPREKDSCCLDETDRYGAHTQTQTQMSSCTLWP